MPVVSVLLVDDSSDFRRFIRGLLETKQEFQVVGEAADGLEAVRQTAQLKPDLILLNTALPKLDGMQAAKATLKAAPRSRIVFVTANSSTSLAEKALKIGAKGYVVKSEVAKDLLRAIEVVMSNKQFVSEVIVGYESLKSFRNETQIAD